MAYRRLLAILFAASLGTVLSASSPAAVPVATVPVVSIGSVSFFEGNAGSRVVVLPVTLSAPSTSSVSGPSATSCYAVGNYRGGPTEYTLIERYA